MLQDWQVDVQSGVADSVTTFLSKSGTTLKDFIETLNVNTTALDARYLTASSYPDMAAMYASLQPDYGNLVDEVTLSIDGVNATVTPNPQTGRSRALAVDLNAVTDITASINLAYGNDEYERIVKNTDNTIQLRRWARYRQVFRLGGSYGAAQRIPMTTVGTYYRVALYNSITTNPNIDGDCATLNTTTHVITISRAGAYNVYASCDVQTLANPSNLDEFQALLHVGDVTNPGVNPVIGGANMQQQLQWAHRRYGTNTARFETIIKGVGLQAGDEIFMDVIPALFTNAGAQYDIWAASMFIEISE